MLAGHLPLTGFPWLTHCGCNGDASTAANATANAAAVAAARLVLSRSQQRGHSISQTRGKEPTETAQPPRDVPATVALDAVCLAASFARCRRSEICLPGSAQAGNALVSAFIMSILRMCTCLDAVLARSGQVCPLRVGVHGPEPKTSKSSSTRRTGEENELSEPETSTVSLACRASVLDMPSADSEPLFPPSFLEVAVPLVTPGRARTATRAGRRPCVGLISASLHPLRRPQSTATSCHHGGNAPPGGYFLLH